MAHAARVRASPRPLGHGRLSPLFCAPQFQDKSRRPAAARRRLLCQLATRTALVGHLPSAPSSRFGSAGRPAFAPPGRLLVGLLRLAVHSAGPRLAGRSGSTALSGIGLARTRLATSRPVFGVRELVVRRTRFPL